MAHKVGVPRLPEPSPTYSVQWMYDFIRVLTSWMRQMTTETFEESGAEAIETVTVDTIMGPGSGCLLVNSAGGDVDITLPDPETVFGREFTVKRINAGGGSITIASPSGNIDGSATKTLTSIYSSVRVKSDGTNYWIVTSF